MNYHNITKNDMLNGDGIRVVLWVSGCEHACKGCHNPQTHNTKSGIKFDDEARVELMEALSKPHISGITFSGGDPMHHNNKDEIGELVKEISDKFPNKNIWIYTGCLYEEFKVRASGWYHLVDVVVDGKYVEELRSPEKQWVGSSNQKIYRRK